MKALRVVVLVAVVVAWVVLGLVVLHVERAADAASWTSTERADR